MKVSGVTIVKNAVIYGYPIVESIKSLLPLVDEFIINVGKSEDNTKELINSIADRKIKIIETEWDETLRTGGQILSLQTNIALKQCSGDWIFYLQADEVIHENDYDNIYEAMKTNFSNNKIDGLAFEFIHFYGSAWTYQNARNWYKHEVRIIRNYSNIVSYGDAQSFRMSNGKKLKAKVINAKIYHYGWARPPEVLLKKVIDFNKLWHNDEYIKIKFANFDIKKCLSDLDNLRVFIGTHPRVMYNNCDIISLDNFLFVMQLRENYLRQRTFLQFLRGLFRRIPLGQHRGFKQIS